MSSKSQILLIKLCFLISLFTGTTSQLMGYFCPDSSTPTSANYLANLNSLLSSLSSNATNEYGFHNSTVSGGGDGTVYGLFMCRGDVPPGNCSSCVGLASATVLQICPQKKTAVLWYDHCMLRYSNGSMFGKPDLSVSLNFYNSQNDSQPAQFTRSVQSTLDQMASQVTAAGNRPGKKFAILEANFNESEKIYSMGQCTPDLSDPDCQSCLKRAIQVLPDCCYSALGARTLFPSCNVRYEVNPFYNASAPSPAPVPIRPPPPNSPPSSGKSGNSSSKGIITIVVLVIGIVLFVG